MSKILLFAILAAVVYFALRAARAARERREREGAAPGVESMVACAGCGVNLPRSEALESRGRFYCSEEHRARDAA